jgi:hypothetical protein
MIKRSSLFRGTVNGEETSFKAFACGH